MDITGIVLAAGQGKRMKSKRYKVLHPVCGKPMVEHVMDTLEKVGTARNIVIVGHGAEAVQAHLGERAQYVLQREQKGTGHAVMQAAPMIEQQDGISLIVCGDTPLVNPDSLRQLCRMHREKGAACSILTARLDDPFGYGRVVRASDGRVVRIVEQKDCTAEEAEIREINTGVYCFENRKLADALKQISNDNAQGEYYLPDAVTILVNRGETVEAYCGDAAEAVGVNNRVQLAEAERLMRKQIATSHMLNGVTIVDPEKTYIEKDVKIARDTVILPGCHLKGHTEIGEDCVIGPNADVTDCRLGDRVQIRHSVLWEAVLGSDVTVGPYAYLRPGTELADRVKIGDFVEVKKARIGEGSKVPHLSYVGDAEIGTDVNFGCGAITVNYDGFNKHRTVIEDGAFIGSNANLIAPVRIGSGAFVVAGSTITEDVETDGLAIARARQTTKPGYAGRLKERLKKRKIQEEN